MDAFGCCGAWPGADRLRPAAYPTSYIGADAAKAIALDAAGIAEGTATFASADLENRNGTDYYQVTFTAGGQNYAYDIDAVTGVVISGTQNGGTGGGADASGTETAAVGEEGQGDCPEPRRPDRGSGHLCPEPPGLGRTAARSTTWSSTPATTKSMTTRLTPPRRGALLRL